MRACVCRERERERERETDTDFIDIRPYPFSVGGGPFSRYLCRIFQKPVLSLSRESVCVCVCAYLYACVCGGDVDNGRRKQKQIREIQEISFCCYILSTVHDSQFSQFNEQST